MTDGYPFRTIYTNQNRLFSDKLGRKIIKDARYPRLTNNTNRSAWNYQNNDFMLQNSSLYPSEDIGGRIHIATDMDT